MNEVPERNLDLKYVQVMRALRQDADMTQQQVADYLGTSQTMYARYERGANEIPVHHLIRLCELFDVTAGQLLGMESLEPMEKRRKRKSS